MRSVLRTRQTRTGHSVQYTLWPTPTGGVVGTDDPRTAPAGTTSPLRGARRAVSDPFFLVQGLLLAAPGTGARGAATEPGEGYLRGPPPLHY